MTCLLEHLCEYPESHIVYGNAFQYAPKTFLEPDIYDYGIKGIIVLDSDCLVDLLVLNHFHKEKGVLVLSCKGYPSYLISIAISIIKCTNNIFIGFMHNLLVAEQLHIQLQKNIVFT